MPEEIYQIKVTLVDTDPPIWRRLLVPTALTLAQLHNVLQRAMRWENCHLHEFRVGRERFGPPEPDWGLEPQARAKSEKSTHLSDVLKRPRASLVYTYDFGDSWEHKIVLEKRLDAEPGRAYPTCIGGELEAPPEDCGGVPGYYNILDALADPKHEEHEFLREWIGGEYDPQAFSVDEVNRRLKGLQRPKKKAAKGKT